MHEVETMFYLNETPWHGLGKKIEHSLTVEEAIKEAGLDWTVALEPVFRQDGTQVEDAQLCYRVTDNQQLGTVGPQYTPLQNIEAFKFFQPFLDAGEAKFETAGSLRKGKRIWVLAKINREPLVVVSKADDKIDKYVLLSNSHDGTMAIRVGFTPIRVVCANTMAMAIDSNASKLIRVRHRSKVVQTLEQVRETMDLANQVFEANAEQYRLLASKEANLQDLEKYVKIVFNPTADESSETRMMGKIIPLFEHGRGNDLPGVKGTYWAAYNAVAEYLAYDRGREQGTRLDNLWFGTAVDLNRRALNTAVTMALAA